MNDLQNILIGISHRFGDVGNVFGGVVLFFAAIFIFRFVYFFFTKNGAIIKGKYYTWFNTASDANPAKSGYISGHTWTHLDKLKSFSAKNKKKKNSIYVNNVRLFDKYAEDSHIPKFLRKKAEDVEIYFDIYEFCRSVLGIGSAGSGKTELLLSIMDQHKFSLEVYFSKKGDFEKYFMRPGIDILVNPKLPQGVIHDVLSEDIQYIMEYINTLMSASIGKNQDYFSGSAKQKLEKFCQKIKINEKDNALQVREKWMQLIEFYEQAVKDAASGDQKSEKDVMSTVRATMELLYLAAYRIENGAETFTVQQFFTSENKIRLFLAATDPSLDGMMAATYSVLVKWQLAQPDSYYSKEFIVAYFLDEFLSLQKVVDDELLAEQTRVGRSKKIASFKFLQRFPSKDDELKELISNYQYLIIFSVLEPKTIEVLNSMIGDIEYTYKEINESFSGNKKTTSKQNKDVKEPIINQYKLQILQNEGFSHILFAPKEKLLYKGYTPRVEIPIRKYVDMESEIDLAEFYRWKNAREDKQKTQADFVRTQKSYNKNK